MSYGAVVRHLRSVVGCWLVGGPVLRIPTYAVVETRRHGDAGW
jgi:hypothetical protein